MNTTTHDPLILLNGCFHTVDKSKPQASAVAIQDGKFLAVGDSDDVLRHRGANSTVIDLHGRTVVPGLNDSHLHLIRGGLNYNLELRWEGVPSLADALRMLKEQALRTPNPQWVRVVGGWNEFQFAEKRMPTLDEINAAAPDTPVFILHLYDRALLNRAALRVVGYTKDTPNPPGGEIVRDAAGNPTGMLIARPNAMILYATLAKGPKLPLELQVNSTRQFMRELNRLGVTSAIDAGGGFQNYPEDYSVVDQLAKDDQLTIRIAYNLSTQNKGKELDDFEKWTEMVTPGQGSDFYRHNGAGEMLVFSAADFEDFLEPRPELAGGIAIQHRMAFQGEYFVERYGAGAAAHTPPIQRMLSIGVPVGAGTDATRVASYNPWTALYWLVSGRTVGGLRLYESAARLSRDTALELWTAGSAWFSSEQGKKGRIQEGMLADLTVLSRDFFTVPEEDIKAIESVLTIVGGKIVYGQAEFTTLAPPPIPVLPDWSPVSKVAGHYRAVAPAAKKATLQQQHQCQGACGVHAHAHDVARKSTLPVSDFSGFWGALGCSCFAF